MAEESVVEVELSPHEARLLMAFEDSSEELSLEILTSRAELETAQARSAIERLKLKTAVEQSKEVVETKLSLSEQGADCCKNKLPELRLWVTLTQSGAVPIRDLQKREDMDARDAGAAFGALKKSGMLKLDKGQARLVDGASAAQWDQRQSFLERVGVAESMALSSLSVEDQKLVSDKRLKNLFKLKDTKFRSYVLTPSGIELKKHAAVAADEIGPLTSAMIKDGSWKNRSFRRYSIAKPPKLIAGSRNSYRGFLDKVKQRLIGLGFQEMRGSLVENEFWNMDALFMPQFHPAREIHDVYFVEDPTYADSIAEPYLSQVANAHEGHESSGSKGWGYVFDKERTRRLVLRSQGTVLSARQLAGQTSNGKIDIPGKYFSIARCFRYDEVDATHAPDFFQIEGIVPSKDVSFRHLLGLLTLFATELAGAEEIKCVPAYFPFTEPSVEVHMKHPTLGWMELGGAGIFRPEVSESLGVDVPVIAWGLGLDRMAMVALKKNDIRHLFTNNLPHGLADNRNS
jgi:phenylalanyl-tRNA synthetase alpha chain